MSTNTALNERVITPLCTVVMNAGGITEGNLETNYVNGRQDNNQLKKLHLLVDEHPLCLDHLTWPDHKLAG